MGCTENRLRRLQYYDVQLVPIDLSGKESGLAVNQNFFALDSSLSFSLDSISEGAFRLSGNFFAEKDQRIVVGIDEGQGPTPNGFVHSPAGFDFFYLVGTGRLESFEKQFSMKGLSKLNMFVRRWYTESDILLSIDGRRFEDAVFVMGSCVSRDAFDYMTIPLAGYRARFSYSTLHFPPIYHDKELLNLNQSSFQRRMVEGDLSKENVRLAQLAVGSTVLVDFIDERLPLSRASQSVYTESPEYLATGLARGMEPIDVFSESYFVNFEKGWNFFVAALGHKALLINRVFWATHTSDGSLLPDQKLIAKQNAKLQRIYGLVTRRGEENVKILEYPDSVFLADPEHRWGLSPFHFGSAFYEAQSHAVQREVAANR